MTGDRNYELSAVVLQNGHVDRITGPRCIIKMREGPQCGLYLIGRSVSVLSEGTPVFYDEITRRVRIAEPCSPTPITGDQDHD